jgi:hypothetical protein
MTCKGTLRQVFICLRPITPPPPPYTLFTCKQYLFTQGRGAELNQREGDWGNRGEYSAQCFKQICKVGKVGKEGWEGRLRE